MCERRESSQDTTVPEHPVAHLLEPQKALDWHSKHERPPSEAVALLLFRQIRGETVQNRRRAGEPTNQGHERPGQKTRKASVKAGDYSSEGVQG